MTHDKPNGSGQTPNPGHAVFQIARALITSGQHGDAATRERAREKVRRWVEVLKGMLAGRLHIGSRQPMPSTPVWATAEVVTGGFATGALLAGGPLQPHESRLAERVAAQIKDRDRQALNAFFLTEAGLQELNAWLRSGCYEVQVPEEGALLVMVWLVANGHAEEARELVDTLAPHFASLRFYPIPCERQADFGAGIFLESAGTVLERIRGILPNLRVLAERESIEIWTPLYERMIGLFLETVCGDVPTIQPDADGRWVSPGTKRFFVTGGWPCQQFPDGWRARALGLVSEIDAARSVHQLCGKPRRAKDSFARLHESLRRCAGNPATLTGRDAGMIRLILARHVARRGEPGSEKSRTIREKQCTQVAGPTHHAVAQIVLERLAQYPPDAGLDDVDCVLQPIADHEAARTQLPAGVKIPQSLSRKVTRCLCDTAEALVARGIVTSGDTLARVIPQFTAGLRAQAFDDPPLQTLYASIYRAFRRRRSLLLLNLEQQVRIEELPWIAAVEPYRRKNATISELSRQTLKDVAALTLRAFPHAILPNKLLQEFRALARGGELDIPFVEELAADIFMDNFSPKFTQAAKQATAFLDGSLYARYYDIDCATIHRLLELRSEASANPLAILCIMRAGADSAKRGDVARNGMIIEQAQILTTHNLSLLFQAFSLAAEFRDQLRTMSERTFRWILCRQQAKSENWHAKLIMLKSTAYAWRQMIFYLSQLPGAEQKDFILWTGQVLREQPSDFQTRFAPALRGLEAVSNGESLGDSPVARRFLGWTQKGS